MVTRQKSSSTPSVALIRDSALPAAANTRHFGSVADLGADSGDAAAMAALLEDRAPEIARVIAVAAAPAPRAKERVRVVVPKPSGRRGGRDRGRDEHLSDYLSSLGRIPLLTAETERELAFEFKREEVACWSELLQVEPARLSILQHAAVANDARVAAALAGVPGAEDVAREREACVAAAFAELLREIDDDRTLLEGIFASAESTLLEAAARAHMAAARAHRARALVLRNRFVRANLRLVVSVARRFHHYRLPLVDLIQEGNLGLIKSVHRFDPGRGFRFSTYAHWWIRQAIERAIMNKGAQIRLPVHMFDARREIARVTRDLEARLGREPRREEIAAAAQLSFAKLDEILRAVPREPQSLDDPVGEDEDRTVGEMISDADDLAPDERVIQKDEGRWVRRMLQRLTPMEVDIIVRRFGLTTDDDETLEEIGVSYRLSRERVRQIQVQGLKKIARCAERRASRAPGEPQARARTTEEKPRDAVPHDVSVAVP